MNRRSFLTALGGGALAARAALADALPLDVLLAKAPSRPVVLVTADAASHVAVVEPASGRITRRIATASRPRSIETMSGNTALVAHSELGRCTLIDLAAGSATLLHATFGEPRYAALHPAGEYAFVSDSGRRQIAVIELARLVVVARIPVPGAARHLTVDPSGRRLWTSLGTKAQRVAMLDVTHPERPRVLGTFAPAFLAHDVVAAPDGRHVWVSSGDRRRIAIYDLATHRQVRLVPAGRAPQHVAFAQSGIAFVTSGDDGTLRVHDAGGTLLRTTVIPKGSFNVTRGGQVVVSPSLDRGTLAVLDTAGARRRVVPVTTSAHDACVVGPVAASSR